MDLQILMEIFYSMIGFLLISCGVIILNEKEHKTRIGGFVFWSILGFVFIAGSWLDPKITGVLIIVLGLLSVFKQVQTGDLEIISQAFKDEQAAKLGNKIFIPSIVLAFLAFGLAQFFSMIPKNTFANMSQSGQVAIGLSAVVGILLTVWITKSKAKFVVTDSVRMIRQMGGSSILPQLLAALGAIFTSAGVGTLIAGMLKNVIPNGNLFIGVVMYCVGMALFTMIMGNAFAAFSVITVGIGIPFVLSTGANPVMVCSLALTAGYCGTLMTPMAANFNIVPANLLETKSQYTLIKYQVPFALIMLLAHIILMFVCASAFHI